MLLLQEEAGIRLAMWFEGGGGIKVCGHVFKVNRAVSEDEVMGKAPSSVLSNGQSVLERHITTYTLLNQAHVSHGNYFQTYSML